MLNVAVEYGSGSASAGVSSIVPTTAVTAPVALVQVATPLADGTIIHVVDTGQALWNIAAAYDVTVDQLKDLNNLSGDIINVGQEIVIQVASTATPTPAATGTLRAPTRTPVPAQTVQAVSSPEDDSTSGDNGDFLGFDSQTMGLALILICGVGLALIIVGNMKKNKSKSENEKPPDSESEQ